MIFIQNVSQIFNAGKINEFQALKEINLHIEPNKITVIKGPSGSGKTTLLSIIGRVIQPTSGRIYLNNQEIISLSERFAAQMRRKTFGFIFQKVQFIQGLSVLQNLMIPVYPLGLPYNKVKARAMRLLDEFDMADKIFCRPEQLSGGEAQRIAVARALMNDPPILIADEPTAHLDSQNAENMMKLMNNLKNKGKTLIIASHDPIVFESELTDRDVFLKDGQVLDK